MMTVPGSSTPLPVPFASLGIMQVDDQGRYTAHGTISAGGQVQDVDFPGSIQVNPDCTATDTYMLGPVEGADRLVILENGDEMQVMPTMHPLGPVVGRAYFWRVARREPHCTSAMVRGVYGGTAEGTIMAPVSGQPQLVPAPFSAIGTITFLRDGSGTSVATASLGGSLFDMEFPTMSMQVNSDCTATLEYAAVSNRSLARRYRTIKYIVLNEGDDLIGLETRDSAGLPIVIDSHKRISIVATARDR